jgi:dimethylglycine dehydrogenase
MIARSAAGSFRDAIGTLDQLVTYGGKKVSFEDVLEVLDVADADARGSEPIRKGGKLVGRCTSGGYGWRVRKSLALGMIQPDFGEVGSELDVIILGKTHRAIVVPESPFDPENVRLRG